MKPRVIGVATALAIITIVFTAIVLTIAAIQDYQENKGESFHRARRQHRRLRVLDGRRRRSQGRNGR